MELSPMPAERIAALAANIERDGVTIYEQGTE